MGQAQPGGARTGVVGLSPHPTPYRVRVGGLDLYVRCGADILLTGMNGDLDAEARCPVCNRRIRLRIRSRKVDTLDPPGTVLHVVETWTNPSMANIECERTHLFDDPACLAAWTRGDRGPPGSVVSPQEYLGRWLRLQ